MEMGSVAGVVFSTAVIGVVEVGVSEMRLVLGILGTQALTKRLKRPAEGFFLVGVGWGWSR